MQSSKVPEMSDSVESSTQRPTSEESSLVREQLQKCLRMLKAARNDNEKMASMLLFTHLVKNNDSLTVDSREVFDAIGARFIVRLLNSRNVPEGCPDFMYKSLALSILASFTEEDLLFHPLIVSNLRVITEVLSWDEKVSELPDFYKECIKILITFSRTEDGCKHLLENDCIPVICQAVLHNPEVDILFDVFKGILHYLPQETVNNIRQELNHLLDLLSKKFAECQDLEKFTTCDKLLVILNSFCESQNANQENKATLATSSKQNIRKGVRDILQSRCKTMYKHSALMLASSLIELNGVEWTLATDQILLDLSNTKFWFLLLSITKVELKMTLESGDENEIQQKSAVVVAGYRIIEKTIEFLITDKKGCLSFSDDFVLQMHGVLEEIFECIIQFLVNIGASIENNPSGGTCPHRTPVVIATIRVLCAWLSEETNSIRDAVSKVLPILLDLARSQFREGTQDLPANHDDFRTSNEIILYLLPPLCHLSADKTFSAILIQKEAHTLLGKLFNQLWLRQQKECEEYPSPLITLCNVFLNFAVLEVELIKNNQIFQDILNSIMVSLPQMVHSENWVILNAHITLLGLLLFRHLCPSNQTNLPGIATSFISSCMDFLKQAQMSVCGGAQQTDIGVSLLREWNNISELWFLSVQNLIACAKLLEPVKNILLTSRWIEETKQWLKSSEKNNETIFMDLKPALLSLADLDQMK